MFKLKRIFILIFTSFLIGGCTMFYNDHVESRIWSDYASGINKYQLPDFSYAGYKQGSQPIPSPAWDTINVADFGAFPDDNKPDTKAVQAALNYVGKHKKTILVFANGTYEFPIVGSHKKPILSLIGDNVIIRGQGKSRTILHFPQPLELASPNKQWTTPYIFTIFGNESFYKGKLTTTIVNNSSIGDSTITVENTDELKPGDYIVINFYDKSAENDELPVPFDIDEEWSNFDRGEMYREYNQISSINGNKITLESPLLMDIDAEFTWQVRKIKLGENIGIENLTFSGNWDKNFVHHKNALHDGGWSALRFNNTANSWVKDVEFLDWNKAVAINSSYGVSLLNIKIQGNRGHFGIQATSSSGVLVSNVTDCGPIGQYHAFSVSSFASGTVFHRVKWPNSTSFDMHARYPHATLFDIAEGGFLVSAGGNGGSRANKPNHLQNLVLWNFKSLDTKKKKQYSWWEGNTVYKPKIIGWSGHQPIFNRDELGALESYGKRVSPESLYEAQLKKRLGYLPNWLNPEKRHAIFCNY